MEAIKVTTADGGKRTIPCGRIKVITEMEGHICTITLDDGETIEASMLGIPDYMQVYLEKRLQELRPKHSLEFGTGSGVATEIIAKHSGGVITMESLIKLIEFSKMKLSRFNNIYFQCGYYQCGYYDMKDVKFDFVFVDGPKGCHNRIAPFLFHWPNIKSGALCLFDDANQKGIRELFKLLKGLYGIEYNIDNKDRGIGEFIKP